MRIPLNLAREPFRRDRQVLVASAATGVLLLLTFILLTGIAVSERHAANDTRKQLAQATASLANIRREQVHLDAEMRQPGNEIVLDRSILINTIIRRKAISWTKMLSDLEAVLPSTVRIIAIRPQVNTRDQVSLDMTVAAENPEQVLGFIVKLEGSDVFGSTAVSNIAPPTQNEPIYKYRLSVNYAQKL